MADAGAWPAVGKEMRTLLRAGSAAGFTDRQLLARFATGEPESAEAAFAALVVRHGGLVLRACRDVVGDPHDAEDAAQAVFLVLARRAGSIRKADSLPCWLLGVALRVARRVQADTARRRLREARAAGLAATRDVGPEESAARAEVHARLYEELDRLPDRYRHPLVLCHLEGLTHEQAAERLGLPKRTLHTRLTRARARLRERLTRRGLAPTSVALATSPPLAMAPPMTWVEATARAASNFTSATNGPAGGLIPDTSTALATRVLATMTASKLKSAALVGGIACALLLGALPFALRPKAAAIPIPILIPATDTPQGVPVRSAEVLILDAETGKPIEGATVVAGFDLRHVRLTTDARGVATIDLSSQKISRSLNADVWADGYVQQRDDIRDVRPKDGKSPRLEFRLHCGNETFGGTVRDEQGRPIAGVEVALWGYLGEMKDKKELAWMVRTTTDAEGGWRCGSLRKMRFVHLYLSHPDYLSDDQVHGRKFGEPRGKNDAKLFDRLRDFSDVQVMARGVALSGRVTDEAGKPVPGAKITRVDEKYMGAFLGTDVIWTPADADGRFTIPHAWPGRLLVVARAPGRAPELTRVSAEGDVKDIEFRLKPGKTLSGRVVDGHERPIEGAFVNIDTWRNFRGLGVYLASDRDGRFRWDEAPDERILINVSAEGRVGIFQRPVEPGADVVYTLLKSLVITGRVRDLATKKSIEQAEVEVGRVDPETGEVVWLGRAENGGRTFASGGFLQSTVEAEEPATYQLRVKARGYAPFVTRSIRSDEGEVKIDALLAPPDDAKPLTGVVLTPDGKPAAGAEVILAGPLDGITIKEGQIEQTHDNRRVTADAEGRFAIPPAAQPESPHCVVVAAHESGYAEISRADVEDTSTVRLAAWGQVEGTCKIGTRAMAHHPIWFHNDMLGNSDVPWIYVEGHGRTDAEGHFALARLRPGDIRIVPDGTKLSVGSNGTLVQVEPGGTASVEIGGTGRAVVASVVAPEGGAPEGAARERSIGLIESDRPKIPIDGPASRWWISPEGRAYRRAWIWRTRVGLDAGGMLRIDDLPPGEYRLKVFYTAEPIQILDNPPAGVATAMRKFVIPEIPQGRSDDPLDLGEIRPEVKGAGPARK